MVGTRGLQRFQNLLDAQLEVLGHLGHGRGATAPGAELLLCLLNLDRALLRTTGHVNRPAEVPEVPLEFTEDGRDGEGREGGAATAVEAVHSLDEAEAGHLE